VRRSNGTVFFDWDHTLAYTRTPNNTIGERLAHMFELAGLPYSQAQIEDALQQYHEAVAEGSLPAVVQPQKRRDIARFYGYLFDFLGEQDKSWPVMERLYGTYAQLPTYLYDDSRPALKQVGRLGFKLGIISNHSSSARQAMEDLVGDLVPAGNIVISEELGVHKPAKTIFSYAAARLRTRPQNCILVGDNLQVDAIGAVSVGGYGSGVWLDRHERGSGLDLPPYVTRVASLNQLPSWLANAAGLG
jgi:putative hydrolase of the HAD superfamily